MTRSWRYSWISALATALALLPGPALALDPAELEELETLLHDLGFDPGTVDGVVDPDTIAAIRRYQEFAALSGEPEPSTILLSELRGVAAAFAALGTNREEPPPVAPGPSSDQPEAGRSAESESGNLEAVAEKVVVPPPPPPPKLKPAKPPAVEAEVEEPAATEDEATTEQAPEQTAELPPPQAPINEPPEASTDGQAEVPLPPEPPDPAAEAQARIDAEIAPFRILLNNGSLSRENLAIRFNEEGRQALQNSRFDEAILKFSVAIELNPRFAGAYSNRGTAYQRNEESALAAEDFAKAKQLGFGGMRIRDGKNPFN